MRLRPARPADANALTDLALRSKAHWGYDAAFIEACRAELTITPERIADEAMVVAEVDGRIVGFVAVKGDSLEDLFAEPDAIGTGIGSALLAAAVDIARSNGVSELVIEADPHAVDWYRARGAIDTGTTVPSGSIPGRSLPLL
ncbi:MAG: GNAT family N-acetyltransferase, partial [Acidimicrobiia bacterium]